MTAAGCGRDTGVAQTERVRAGLYGLGRAWQRLDWAGPVPAIAFGALIASFAMNFWIPFLPLYEQHLGAHGEADALFWVAVASTGQGIGRILMGPVWGALADRYGRRLMFIRALFAASLTTIVVGFALQPWHVAVALTMQGTLSGFIPAAVALTTVTVPAEEMSSALATVTGAQYAGTMLGPALGALLAALVGLRAAILVGAALPVIGAFVVFLRVPRDSVRRTPRAAATRGSASIAVAATSARRQRGIPISRQLLVGLFLYFIIYSASQLVRVATPEVLKGLLHGGSAEGATGVAFTVAGVGSVVGALWLARLTSKPSTLRRSLVTITLVTAVAHVLLAATGVVWLYIVWFTVAAVVEGTIIPSTNTLIATSVPPEVRGTAFGVAASVQATGFILGPVGAAAFAAFSLRSSFLAVAAAFVAAALAALLGLRRITVRVSEATASGLPSA